MRGKKKFPRQTELDLQMLKKAIDLGEPRRCLWINEVGTIFYNQDEDAKKAEELLCVLLTSKSEMDQVYALCFLLDSEHSSVDTQVQVDNFVKEDKNRNIVARVKEMKAHFAVE